MFSRSTQSDFSGACRIGECHLKFAQNSASILPQRFPAVFCGVPGTPAKAVNPAEVEGVFCPSFGLPFPMPEADLSLGFA
jgi:hypothetical protein